MLTLEYVNMTAVTTRNIFRQTQIQLVTSFPPACQSGPVRRAEARRAPRVKITNAFMRLVNRRDRIRKISSWKKTADTSTIPCRLNGTNRDEIRNNVTAVETVAACFKYPERWSGTRRSRNRTATSNDIATWYHPLQSSLLMKKNSVETMMLKRI